MILKVSWFQNVFSVSSFRPKNQQIFLRISALASKKKLNKNFIKPNMLNNP